MVDQNSDHFIVAVLKCQHEKGIATDTHGDYITLHGPGVFVAKRTKSLLKLDFLWSPL
jgi:hypothetical protein